MTSIISVHTSRGGLRRRIHRMFFVDRRSQLTALRSNCA
jgi:hypothetical protein